MPRYMNSRLWGAFVLLVFTCAFVILSRPPAVPALPIPPVSGTCGVTSQSGSPFPSILALCDSLRVRDSLAAATLRSILYPFPGDTP